LIHGLERGASVTPVPVYQWALPEDIGPLQRAIQAIVDGKIDVLLITHTETGRGRGFAFVGMAFCARSVQLTIRNPKS